MMNDRPTKDEAQKIVKNKSIRLSDRTVGYWDLCHDQSFMEAERYALYISHLLGDELKEAALNDSDDVPRLQRMKVHTLAMTVGASFEPLLQTICVLQPRRLVLVLNREYAVTGEEHGKALKRIVLTQLQQADGIPRDFRPSHMTDADITCAVLSQADSPTSVFHILNEAFRKEEARLTQDDLGAGYINAVDITGAKKSMIVGSFLYAAHSRLTITYVDFDKYDDQYAKPYGYTCRIGRIDDPYEAFRLRDWDRVRSAYENYNFRSAISLLTGGGVNEEAGILGAMNSRLEKSHQDLEDARQRRRRRQEPISLFRAEDTASVKRLIGVLSAFEAWENGQYATSRRRLYALDFDASTLTPIAVGILGACWPDAVNVETTDPAELAQSLYDAHLRLKEGRIDNEGSSAEGIPTEPEQSIYANSEWVLAYACDEIAKIRRLIDQNEDYRSAFIRAVGLDEFLIKARLAIRWLSGQGKYLEIDIDGRFQPLSDDIARWQKLFRRLVKMSRFKDFFLAVRNENDVILNNRTVKPTARAPKMDDYWVCLGLGYSECVDSDGNPILRQLRNEAIHTHMYIPKKLADAAFEVAEAGLDEFIQNGWLDLYQTTGWLADHVIGKETSDLSRFQAPGWQHLCEACEITFLPPKLLLNDDLASPSQAEPT